MMSILNAMLGIYPTDCPSDRPTPNAFQLTDQPIIKPPNPYQEGNACVNVPNHDMQWLEPSQCPC